MNKITISIVLEAVIALIYLCLLGILTAIAILLVAGAVFAQDRPVSELRPIAAAQSIYDPIQPPQPPIVTPQPVPLRVSFIINNDGHLVMFDERGTAADLDALAFLIDKFGGIMRQNIIRQAQATQDMKK